MKLRDYQRSAVRELVKRLENHRRVIAVAPTGSGKTVIGGALVRRLKGKRVLWLAHRWELIDQAYEKLRWLGIPQKDLGILVGNKKKRTNEEARVLVASVQMFSRTREVPEVDLVVVDEAHRARSRSYQNIIESVGDAWVLGLTATPWRLDGKGLGDIFDDMLVVATPMQLVVEGHIAEPICYGVPEDKAKAMVDGVPTNRGDFHPKKVAKAMMKPALMGDVVRECERLAPGRRTIVFAASREHGKALHRRFKKAGRRAAYVDGETPVDERAAIVEGLGSGKIDVAVNVDIFTEGFDEDSIQCVAIARPTKSLTRFLQYVGRACRPYGKERPIILDHAGNCHRHSMPLDDRDWSLEARPKSSSGGSPVKLCAFCEAVIPSANRECPECGEEQPLSERELQEREAELELLRTVKEELEMKRKALIDYANKNALPASWVDRVMSDKFGETV